MFGEDTEWDEQSRSGEGETPAENTEPTDYQGSNRLIGVTGSVEHGAGSIRYSGRCWLSIEPSIRGAKGQTRCRNIEAVSRR